MGTECNKDRGPPKTLVSETWEKLIVHLIFVKKKVKQNTEGDEWVLQSISLQSLRAITEKAPPPMREEWEQKGIKEKEGGGRMGGDDEKGNHKRDNFAIFDLSKY